MIPFDSIIGNNQAQLAVILTLVQPTSCSLLISGVSGTGKTSLLRSLYSIVGEEGSERIVNIPSSTTSEMLSDFINTDLLIKSGAIEYKSGLLSRLGGKVALMDNINLHDRVVIHSILEHKAKSTKENVKIIATINPDEGAITSTLLDQFDLFVELKTIEDISLRKQIIRNTISQTDKLNISGSLHDTIKKSQAKAYQIRVDEELMTLVAKVCQDYYVMGHRGDIALLNAAIAHAAWMGKSRVEQGDLQAVQELALIHRRLNPSPELPEPSPDEQSQGNEQVEQNLTETDGEPDLISEESKGEASEENTSFRPQAEDSASGDVANDESQKFDTSAQSREHQDLPVSFYLEYDPLDRLGRVSRQDTGFGSRIKSTQNTLRGSYRRAVPNPDSLEDIAFSATIRAAAPFQKHRQKRANAAAPRILLEPTDYRSQIKQHRTGYHILFVVDASGSMGVNRRMQKVKGLIFELLKKSYVKRDRVGMLAFRGDSCEVILPFIKSVSKAYELLKEINTGGRTPLYLGMSKANEMIQALKRREKQTAPVIVLLTDGRATSSYKSENSDTELVRMGKQLQREAVKTIVIDTEEGFIRLGLAQKLANNIGAQYYTLEQLDSDKILRV